MKAPALRLPAAAFWIAIAGLASWSSGGSARLASAPAVPPPGDAEECTIAVLTGEATADGRPILWKNRDAPNVDNEVVYFEDGLYRYVALVNAGEKDKAWIGVNERGFAILNALSYNLPDTVYGGITNGELMKTALQRCATVAEFDSYMKETNVIGRDNPANLAVMDALGGAAIFEAAGRDFVRYDAKNFPHGFLARTNYSMAGDTSTVDTWRYHRCRRLIERELAAGGVSLGALLQRVGRDLRAVNCDPYPLPFDGSPPGFPNARGYVVTTETINRRSSVAAGAVAGVRPGEDARLCTFYPVLGPPVVAIPVPVWVAAGKTPPELDGPVTSPLCDEAKQRGRACYDDPSHYQLLNTARLVTKDPEHPGFLTRAERVERWLLPETEILVDQWREWGVDPGRMAVAEAALAERAYEGYTSNPQPYAEPRENALALDVTPNPSRSGITIRYEAASVPPRDGTIGVIDVTGRRVATLRGSALGSGPNGILKWDGRDERGVPVASGVYFLRPSWPVETRGAPIAIIR